jgi:hypothetical protein
MTKFLVRFGLLFLAFCVLNASAQTTIPTGNIVWVDAVNGNDSTGMRGQLGKPFLTLTAAKNAANSGDVIVVFPGTYNGNNLLKDGVNWHFMDGATITGAASAAIFDDTMGSGYVTCIISGEGKFDGTTNGVINLRRTDNSLGSNISFTADSVVSQITAIYSRGATLHVRARTINSTGATFAAAVWWLSGPMHVEANEITSASGAAVYATAPSNELVGYYLWVQADLIQNTATSGTAHKAVWFQDFEPTAREWIQALQIEGPIAVDTSLDGSVNYVKAEKIFGQINHSVGSLYVDAQKISDGGLKDILINLSGGNSWINISQIDDAPFDPLMPPPPPRDLVAVSGGTHYLRGSSLTRSTSSNGSGNGITISGGALTADGLTISTQSGWNDLTQAGTSTLTVMSCKYDPGKINGTITSGDPRVFNGVIAKTSNYTASSTDGNTFFTNTGATGEVDFTLPTAAAGLTYSFYVDALHTVKVICPGSATIQLAGSVTSAGGNAVNSTTGSSLTLVCVTSGSSGKWVAQSSNGKWILN